MAWHANSLPRWKVLVSQSFFSLLFQISNSCISSHLCHRLLKVSTDRTTHVCTLATDRAWVPTSLCDTCDSLFFTAYTLTTRPVAKVLVYPMVDLNCKEPKEARWPLPIPARYADKKFVENTSLAKQARTCWGTIVVWPVMGNAIDNQKGSRVGQRRSRKGFWQQTLVPENKCLQFFTRGSHYHARWHWERQAPWQGCSVRGPQGILEVGQNGGCSENILRARLNRRGFKWF